MFLRLKTYKSISLIMATQFLKLRGPDKNKFSAVVFEDTQYPLPTAVIPLNLFSALISLTNALAEKEVPFDHLLAKYLIDNGIPNSNAVMADFINFRRSFDIELAEDEAFKKFQDCRLFITEVESDGLLH